MRQPGPFTINMAHRNPKNRIRDHWVTHLARSTPAVPPSQSPSRNGANSIPAGASYPLKPHGAGKHWKPPPPKIGHWHKNSTTNRWPAERRRRRRVRCGSGCARVARACVTVGRGLRRNRWLGARYAGPPFHQVDRDGDAAEDGCCCVCCGRGGDLSQLLVVDSRY